MNDEMKCFRERVFGPSVPREEVMRRIYESPSVYPAFERLSEPLRDEFVSFCMGARGLNVTYDPVFKRIFDPEAHASRLEDFLSCCLGQEVRILSALPTEYTRVREECRRQKKAFSYKDI